MLIEVISIWKAKGKLTDGNESNKPHHKIRCSNAVTTTWRWLLVNGQVKAAIYPAGMGCNQPAMFSKSFSANYGKRRNCISKLAKELLLMLNTCSTSLQQTWSTRSHLTLECSHNRFSRNRLVAHSTYARSQRTNITTVQGNFHRGQLCQMTPIILLYLEHQNVFNRTFQQGTEILDKKVTAISVSPRSRWSVSVRNGKVRTLWSMAIGSN